VASAGTAASIFLKPLDFQDRLYRRGETPLHHHAPYSRSRLTDPAFAGSVSPRRYADLSDEASGVSDDGATSDTPSGPIWSSPPAIPRSWSCVIGGSSEEDRRAPRAPRNQNNRGEFDPVAHRNHLGAPDIIKTLRVSRENRWYFAFERSGRTCFVSGTERCGDGNQNDVDSRAHTVTLPEFVDHDFSIDRNASASD
jgi:hypothetical protein